MREEMRMKKEDKKTVLPHLAYGEGTMKLNENGTIVYKKYIHLKDGNSVRKTVNAKTVTECFKRMSKLEKKLYKRKKDEKSRDKCLKEEMSFWLNEVKKNRLKTQSFQRLESTIRIHILPSELGLMKVSMITSKDLQKFIDLTDVFKDWQTKKYGQIKKALKEKGFTKIDISKEATSDRVKNQLVSRVKLGDDDFTSGDCYLPETAPIEIKYYMLKSAIGDTADSLEGEQYAKVVEKLKEKGFMNIELQRANNLINGWITKEGSIKVFSINGETDFSASTKFFCDDKIVIIVNTFKEGCDDITIIAD